MKSYVKYGIATVCCWNLLLLVAMVVRALMKDVSIAYFFDDGMGGVVSSLFILAWSLIWYGIGARMRKEYLMKRAMYRDMFPDIDEQSFDAAYRSYYFTKYARLFFRLSLLAIPWYIIGHVSGTMDTIDYVAIIILLFISATCFLYYKSGEKSIDA